MFNRVIIGDCRETLSLLPEATFQCCVTSPPYWGLRDYGVEGQLGLECTPQEYVENIVEVFSKVRRVLRNDGTLWLNIGDSYVRSPSNGGSGPGEKNESRWGYGSAQSAKRGSSDGMVGRADRPGGRVSCVGLKPKDMVGIPWRLAFALQDDGWFLRSDIIWHKPNAMPESVADRPTKSHEYVFLLAKSDHYFFDADSIKEQVSTETRNARTVWSISTQPYSGAHFATMPPRLAERCILAGSRIGEAVLDPFMGSGTVGLAAEKLGRRWLGCELNPKYEKLIHQRTRQTGLRFD